MKYFKLLLLISCVCVSLLEGRSISLETEIKGKHLELKHSISDTISYNQGDDWFTKMGKRLTWAVNEFEIIVDSKKVN